MTNAKGARARFLILAVAASLAGTAIAAGQPQIVGINAAVLNNVRIRSAGASQAHTAVVRQRVALNDVVQTGGRSQLQVLLLDKSTFMVGANARLTIDRFVYDPNRSTRTLAASVTKGAFRFISGRHDATGSTSVRTPIASIGVRGTIFEAVVGEEAVRIVAGETGVGRRVRSDPATASLIILRGPGRGAQGKVL
ncbi:MAG: FecR domain-containing protein, partial [Sphingomonas sp.]